MLIPTFWLALLAIAGCRHAIATTVYTDEKTASVLPVIVVGFMGGRVRHDNLVHSGVQMAAWLRAEYGAGEHVEVFEDWSMGAGVRRFLRR